MLSWGAPCSNSLPRFSQSFFSCCLCRSPRPGPARDERVEALAREVRPKGWIVYGARSENGHVGPVPLPAGRSAAAEHLQHGDFEEGARGSRRRPAPALPPHRQGTTTTTTSGAFRANWSSPRPTAPIPSRWARTSSSPGPPGRPTASRSPASRSRGSRSSIWSLRRVLRRLPRQGVYQQMYWSPDGKWFCGCPTPWARCG